MVRTLLVRARAGVSALGPACARLLRLDRAEGLVAAEAAPTNAPPAEAAPVEPAPADAAAAPAGAAPAAPAPAVNAPPTMMPYQQVPIVINSFNRVESLRRLIGWLERAGYRNLVVIDNASSYPPLLEYLAEIERAAVARVVRLDENVGHTALWDRGLLDALGIATEFVYTDPDVVPADSCPADVVELFQRVLRDEPGIAKIGLGLRLDDVPDTYAHKDVVLAWERRFWLRPAARGLFLAPIDTTFALHRPRASHDVFAPALRTGWPYLASHEGWYVDSMHPTEEQVFYAQAAAKGSHWSVSDVPVWLRETAREATQRHPHVLHLGSGRDLIPGWINVDEAPGIPVDVQFDLESCAKKPLPLADDSVDGIYGCHFLEHVRDPLPLLQELHRVAKNGAKLVFRLPYGGTNDAFEDPTHRRAYFEHSFVYFGQPAYSRADYGYRGDWNIERIVLVVPSEMARTPIEEIRERIRTLRNVVLEMIVHLRAVKPVRPARHDLLQWPTPEIAFSRLDTEASFERIEGPPPEPPA